MSSNKRFSILVPIYNVEEYLRKCLDSLVEQNESSYEIVLVDDGSTDNCGKICEEYQSQYSEFVNVIHQPNMGLVMARRTGIKNAKGEYFVFVDADDFVEKNLIKKLDEIVSQYHPDMILYGATYFDGSKFLPFYKPLYAESTLITDKREYFEATLKHTVSNGIWGKAVKRDIVDIETDYSKFSKVTIGEDLLQSLPYITNADSIYFLNDCLYHYRINLNSMAHDFKMNRYDSLRIVEEELGKWAVQWNLENKDELIAYHAMKETVLNTLLTYTKSKHRIFTVATKQLIKKIREDSLMRNRYEGVNKKMFNYVQNSLIKHTFRGGYNYTLLLLFVIRAFYKIKEIRYRKRFIGNSG